MNEEIKKIINQIEDRLALHEAIKEPVSKDLEKAIKLSVAYEELLKENQQLKEQLERSEKARKEAIELLSIVYGISVDYDGFNDVAGLKSVIDDMVRFTKKAKNILDIDKGE